MTNERLELAKRLYADHHERGLTYAEIATANGWVRDGKPRRGKVARMIADYSQYTGVSGVSSTPMVDSGVNTELARLRAEIADLRSQLTEQEEEALYGHNLGRAWKLDGDWVIAGDIHLNTVNTEFMRRPLQIAMQHLEKPRRFLIAGDFLNADAWSGYESVYPLPSFGKELQAARAFLDLYLTVFDEIYVFMGNHDLRVTKRTHTAIMPEDLMRMISHDPRIKVSHWGHAVVDTPRGEYRITHGSDYSIQQLSVADQMAQKYAQNIILWHEHHSAIGLDRYKRHIVVNGGGLFDQESMAYTQIEDSKKARMANGFVMLRRGYPYVFNDYWTDWDFWVSKSNVIQLYQAA